jgi:glycosyltransferase involved in cell wall biosynthesis
VDPGKNGFVVPIDDPQAMARAFDFIYTNLADFNCAEIALAARASFSINVQAQELLQVYQTHLGK